MLCSIRLHLVVEPMDGLARIALSQGAMEKAVGHIEEILERTENCQKLDGLIDPFQPCLTCFQVLRVINDPRSSKILQDAHRQLQARADKISDGELRISYLENVASHRDLLKIYRESE